MLILCTLLFVQNFKTQHCQTYSRGHFKTIQIQSICRALWNPHLRTRTELQNSEKKKNWIKHPRTLPQNQFKQTIHVYILITLKNSIVFVWQEASRNTRHGNAWKLFLHRSATKHDRDFNCKKALPLVPLHLLASYWADSTVMTTAECRV